ncbi:UNVERIFIED_CONTAM: Retrovirus-related Pol polyprotein from transposon TNT 1-94 [Sesamum indicum]
MTRKHAFYKYLRVWGSPTYVKRLVGDKLDSRSSLCKFVGYPKETGGIISMIPPQKVFVLQNVVFLKKGFLADTQHEELLLEESTEATPQMDPERYGFLDLTGQLDNDPKTYGEAMLDIDSGKWVEAMKSEMDSISLNKLWMLVCPPKGVKPVRCKWIYKHKLGADGKVRAFKARLVVKGYTQRSVDNFEETYSPQMDVKMTFFNGLVEEDIYMDDFVAVKRGYDFIKNDIKDCVHKKVSGSSIAFLVLYVDDILLIGNDVKMLGFGRGFLHPRHQIIRDRSKDVRMMQTSYLEKVLKRFKMKNSKRGFLPMRHGFTRPDVAFALSVMRRYQACAGEAHWTAVKTILMYLRRTKDMLLGYGGGELILEAWKRSKHDSTTESTIEAEYIATSKAAMKVVWMKNYIQDLGVVRRIAKPVVIFYDNNEAIAQAKKPTSHHRSKHILRHYHLPREMVREIVERGDVQMDGVTSAENIEDLLTKPVSLAIAKSCKNSFYHGS